MDHRLEGYATLQMVSKPIGQGPIVSRLDLGDTRMASNRRAGVSGAISLLLGILISFFFGAAIAYTFGYTDEVSMTTIGGGAATYIVEPVTGASIGAKSESSHSVLLRDWSKRSSSWLLRRGLPNGSVSTIHARQ